MHWEAVVQKLAASHRLILPNLGHLFMSKQELSFSQQVEIFAAWLTAHFPDQKVHIAGISYGGALAWGVATAFPKQVDKVILINPMPPSAIGAIAIPVIKQMLRLPLNTKALYLILRTPIGRFFLKRASEVFRVERANFWDRIDDLHGRKLLFVCHVILRFSWILKNENWTHWEQALQRWSHETLFVFDPQDTLFTKNTYLKLQKTLKISNAIQIPGAGHQAIHFRANEISQLIFQFIQSQSNSQGKVKIHARRPA